MTGRKADFGGCSRTVLRKPISSMITSRGCPGKCVFCSIHCVWGRGWRHRSAKSVVDEIEHLVKKYGVREIHFEDDNLTLKKERTLEFCRLIKKRKLDIKWTTPNGVAIWSLDEELLKTMKESGCYKLCFGIETGSAETQKFIRKNIDLERAKKIIRLANRIGIWTHAFFIVGFPYETEKSIKDTLDFAIKSDLDFASFFIATPYPQTDLYEVYKKENLIKDLKWSELRVSASSVKTKHFTREQLEKIQKKLFMSFFINRLVRFLNPYLLWLRLKRIRSIEDLRFIARFGMRFLQIIR